MKAGGRLNIFPYRIKFPGAMVHNVMQRNPIMKGPSHPRPPKVMKFQRGIKL